MSRRFAATLTRNDGAYFTSRVRMIDRISDRIVGLEGKDKSMDFPITVSGG